MVACRQQRGKHPSRKELAQCERTHCIINHTDCGHAMSNRGACTTIINPTTKLYDLRHMARATNRGFALPIPRQIRINATSTCRVCATTTTINHGHKPLLFFRARYGTTYPCAISFYRLFRFLLFLHLPLRSRRILPCHHPSKHWWKMVRLPNIWAKTKG